MQKFTKEELKKYLQTEIEKMAILEGWIKVDNTSTKELSIQSENSNSEIVKESEFVQLEDVKLLAEEVKRMKELVDFRSPLLKKDE